MKHNFIPFRAIFLGFAFALSFSALMSEAAKTTLMLPLDDESGWRDMAFLAAVPASEMANDSGGSLIALEPTAEIGPETRDYLRRYAPDSVFLIGDVEVSSTPNVIPGDLTILPASTAEDAALRLSRTFWKTSTTAVICYDDDYASALVAAPLAARLKAPLLYATTSGLSAATEAELKRLGVTRLLTVGPDVRVAEAVNLAGAKDVMKWAWEQKLEVDYLAAVNPLDRTDSKVVKLSMVGAQLAAGRNGLVVPLSFKVEWKKPFKSKMPEGELPADFQAQEPPAKTGILQAGATNVAYILSNAGDRGNEALFVDRDGSGAFAGPIHSGDTIELDEREWVVSLGQGSSFHDSDVHLTWPTVDVLKADLAAYDHILGLPPTYLCLVGLPDAIPHGIERGRVLSPDTVTDLPFAMLGDAPSSDVAVGRLVAEDVRFGSLYAARVLTYAGLLDSGWADRACQAEWENGFCWLLSNVGFDADYRLTSEDIPWAEEPTEERRGTPAPSFSQDSPAASANVLIHLNHSWNFELGRTMKWDATVLMAPTLVESGGCGTTALDQRAPGQAIVEGASGMRSPELAVRHRSVVSRVLRLGSVGFVGGSRAMSAQQVPLRHEFWNGVLAGESIGVAHRRSQNAGLLIARELGESGSTGSYSHNLYSRMLIGDPAVSIQLPGEKQSAPARTELVDGRLTVHAPEHWEIMKLYVPPDWKKWVDRDIFVARGVGAYSLCFWGPDERDVEVPFVMGEFRSDKKIKEMNLLDSPEAPLGWSGVWQTDRNRDGTYTHRFGVRMLDLDQETGKILGSVEQLDFSVTFE